MATKQVAKLWGMDFSVVPEGLARDEVVAYVDGLKSELQTTGPKGAQQSSLVKLAEQTVIEAHKLAEEVLEQAHTDAEAEAARISEGRRRAGPPAGSAHLGGRPGRERRQVRRLNRQS